MPNDKAPVNSEEEMLAFLEEADRVNGKNTDTAVQPQSVKKPEPTSLGQAIMPGESTISGANDNLWKKIPLENLPSRGLFYAEGSELTIRSASMSEIRQWSTIDETDLLDIDDNLNFIMEKCVRFKVLGGRSWLTWRDILEVDRLYIIFIIHEITFPDGQNELFAKFECTGSCSEENKFSDVLKVRSQMLQLFDMPEELMKWYSSEYKCFEVISEKIGETFYLYLPTVGVIERLRKRISELKNQGRTIDKAFIKFAPYIIQDWSKFGQREYADLQSNSIGWHINKFTFLTKFAEMMQASRETNVSAACPKCGSQLTAPIFSENSFTVKDLFLISGGLDELI